MEKDSTYFWREMSTERTEFGGLEMTEFVTEEICTSVLYPIADESFSIPADAILILGKPLVLVQYGDSKPATDQLAFLRKVLSAAKLAEGDYSFVQPDGKKTALHLLIKAAKPSHILNFGISKDDLLLNAEFADNRSFRFINIPFLSTSSPDLLESNVGIKKIFWEELQKLFPANK